ncbi:hypothetical protein ACTFIY_008175 [Dictyostelium cf. discoideum]
MFRIIKNVNKLLINNNNNNNNNCYNNRNLQIKNYFASFKKEIDLGGIIEKRMDRGEIKERKKSKFLSHTYKRMPERGETEVVIEKKPNSPRSLHITGLIEFCNKHKQEIEYNLKGKSKKPMALCFAYLGTNYYGSSYSLDTRFPAIENLIEKSLIRNGHIALENIGELKRIKLSRSSRTDKGVHSVSTVISAFLLIDEETERLAQFGTPPQYFIDNINHYLPSDIKLISATKPSRTFRARLASTSRVYNYLVPVDHLKDISIDKMNSILSNFIGTYSFHNFTYQRFTYLDSSKLKKLSKINDTQENNFDNDIEDDDDNDNDDDDDDDEDGNDKTKIDIEKEVEELEKLENKKIIKLDRLAESELFVKNPVNVRTIKNFYVEKETVIYEGKEWYRFVVIGESFVMYQIRKMMGFFLSVAKGYQKEIGLQLSLKSPFSICSPISPAFPLILYDVTFSSQKILFPKSRQIQNEFLNSKLIPQFHKIENETNQFSEFFNQLSTFNFRLDDIDQLIILNKEYHEKIGLKKAEREKRIENYKLNNNNINNNNNYNNYNNNNNNNNYNNNNNNNNNYNNYNNIYNNYKRK